MLSVSALTHRIITHYEGEPNGHSAIALRLRSSQNESLLVPAFSVSSDARGDAFAFGAWGRSQAAAEDMAQYERKMMLRESCEGKR